MCQLPGLSSSDQIRLTFDWESFALRGSQVEGNPDGWSIATQFPVMPSAMNRGCTSTYTNQVQAKARVLHAMASIPKAVVAVVPWSQPIH